MLEQTGRVEQLAATSATLHGARLAIQTSGSHDSLRWVHNAPMPCAGSGFIICDASYGATPTPLVGSCCQQELLY